MSNRKCFTLNEAVDYLDNLEVSNDDLESEVDSNFQSTKIFIQPPIASVNNENSDISSGDEDKLAMDASISSGNQLLDSTFYYITV